MASIIDYSLLTLNSDEARETSQAVFKRAFLSPDLTEVHNVQTGADMDRYIPIFGRLGLVGKADPGGCNVNSIIGGIPVSQKQWTPKLISGRIEHCEADIPKLLKMWKQNRIAANLWEGIDNEAAAFVEDQALTSVKESIIRITEFAATNHSPVGDATGDQNLTSGTDKTYFNVLNGMWAQIEADAALAPNNKIYRYTISENAGANKNAQLNLAADAALNVFRALYGNIPSQAFASGNLVIQCTRSLFNNWVDYLETQSLGFTLTRAEQGNVSRWSYRGIPIVVRYDWDVIIRTYFDTGTTYYLPHRAILADINTIPIGTSDEESLTRLDSFYDRVSKKHFIDFAYRIDCKVLDEDLIAVAF